MESGSGDSSRRATPASPQAEARGPVSPLRAFGILGILIAIVAGAGLIATSDDDSEPEPKLSESDNFALTDAEAISVFLRLSRIGLRATQEKDPSLIPLAFTTGGPLANRSHRIIRELREDEIDDKIRYKSLGVEVLSNQPDEIQIVEDRLLYPCFVDAQGKDVTEDSTVVRQQVRWEMSRAGSDWRLHNALLQIDRALEDQSASCP
ncbi:MAG: hypothetical protein M3280_02975 [Actinomycetota bacterium]|nr:hypothetical protein [Actinomycetota bacterium]